MNLPICDDKQDVVEGLVLFKSNALCHSVKNMREIGWSAERYAWKVLPINLLDTYRAEHFWVTKISIEWEAMLNLIAAGVSRYPSETVYWKAFVVIVHL